MKFATVVTDLGSAHPMWFDGRVDACFVPTARLVKLGQFHGVAGSKLHNHGLPLRAAFCGGNSARQGPLRKALARRTRALTSLAFSLSAFPAACSASSNLSRRRSAAARLECSAPTRPSGVAWRSTRPYSAAACQRRITT